MNRLQRLLIRQQSDSDPFSKYLFPRHFMTRRFNTKSSNEPIVVVHPKAPTNNMMNDHPAVWMWMTTTSNDGDGYTWYVLITGTSYANQTPYGQFQRRSEGASFSSSLWFLLFNPTLTLIHQYCEVRRNRYSRTGIYFLLPPQPTLTISTKYVVNNTIPHSSTIIL